MKKKLYSDVRCDYCSVEKKIEIKSIDHFLYDEDYFTKKITDLGWLAMGKGLTCSNCLEEIFKVTPSEIAV